MGSLEMHLEPEESCLYQIHIQHFVGNFRSFRVYEDGVFITELTVHPSDGLTYTVPSDSTSTSRVVCDDDSVSFDVTWVIARRDGTELFQRHQSYRPSTVDTPSLERANTFDLRYDEAERAFSYSELHDTLQTAYQEAIRTPSLAQPYTLELVMDSLRAEEEEEARYASTSNDTIAYQYDEPIGPRNADLRERGWWARLEQAGGWIGG